MSRTHLAVRVELVSGRGEDFWPRPGRVLLAARGMTFDALAEAVDTAFGRWDRAHLHLFHPGRRHAADRAGGRLGRATGRPRGGAQ